MTSFRKHNSMSTTENLTIFINFSIDVLDEKVVHGQRLGKICICTFCISYIEFPHNIQILRKLLRALRYLTSSFEFVKSTSLRLYFNVENIRGFFYKKTILPLTSTNLYRTRKRGSFHVTSKLLTFYDPYTDFSLNSTSILIIFLI